MTGPEWLPTGLRQTTAAVLADNPPVSADAWTGLLGGIRVVESLHVPARDPTPGEDARRIVRHGMADVLAWLGEPVGPAPGERVYTAFLIDNTVLMHPDAVAKIVS